MPQYDFFDVKYNPVKEQIKNYLNAGNNEDDVRNLTIAKNVEPEDFLEFLKLSGTFPMDITVEEWRSLFDYMKKSKKKATGLLFGANNGLEIPSGGGSQWRNYKNSLKDKGFSQNSIDNLEQSSHQILQQLSENTLNKEPIKGLVVGSVQSGKTANMIGLISMAADYGFNYFIVFSGMIDSLRQQTENRIFKDLNLSGTNKNLRWNKLSNPSPRSRSQELNWENIDLRNNSYEKYFTVSLKNSRRMKDLRDWLYSNKPKSKQLKVLIIDDEADQASVNTKDIDEEERTAINDLMLNLVDGYDDKELGAVNYISYTATPYANVLNEVDGLFPKDFVFTLPLSEDYIGPKEIFGLQEPEESPRLHIVRSIPPTDEDIMDDIHAGTYNQVSPSLKEALTWFFITACIFRIYGFKTPVSMLIHTSHRIINHNSMYKVIESFLYDVQNNQEEFFEYAENIYIRETVDITRNDFLNAMPEYSTKKEVRDYPSFKKIQEQMKRVLNETGDDYLTHIPFNEDGSLRYHEGFHIAIDNSGTKVEEQEVRLIYPQKQETNLAPMFIVIGGNTLSRGLTLEGLTTSYFLRDSKQADTLFQMGRWFGYRKGYELLPRIWLNSVVRERFLYITQINEELNETIKEMSSLNQKPGELGIKVKNSPDSSLFNLTSPGKMQSATEANWDFSGINKQTIVFTNDKEMLKQNVELTKAFLNSLSEDKLEIKKSLAVWNGIEYKTVRDFLKYFKFDKMDLFFSKRDEFINWFDEKNADLETSYDDWNIILASRNDIESNTSSSYVLYDKYNIQPVWRSRLKYSGDEEEKTRSIGALTSSAHLAGDLEGYPFKGKKPDRTETWKMRKEQGLNKTPQLILYIVDQDSDIQNRSDKSKRAPLNFDEDIIGMNLYIPGDTMGGNIATHLTITPKEKEQVFSDEDMMED